MQNILQKLVITLNAECGAVMEYNPDENILFCVKEHNLPEEWKSLVNEPDERSLNGTVYSSGNPIIKNNMMYRLIGNDIKSVLIVPIEKNNEIVGTIEIINKINGLFDTKDRAIAAEAAVKISELM